MGLIGKMRLHLAHPNLYLSNTKIKKKKKKKKKPTTTDKQKMGDQKQTNKQTKQQGK